MLEVGSWELLVILVVALLVIGPDKLPGLVRTLGRWVGKARAYVNTVKSDIDREMRLQELQELMNQNERNNSLHEVVEETKSVVNEVQQTLNGPVEAADKPAQIEATAATPAPTTTDSTKAS